MSPKKRTSQEVLENIQSTEKGPKERAGEIEKTPELEKIIDCAREITEKAIEEIEEDLKRAEKLKEEVPEEASGVIQRVSSLKSKVSEKMTAFEAMAERLNSPYVISPELARIVEVSRFLEKPLLLEGEPGTGKTSLAYAIAGEEGLRIIHVQCKSTTTAQELLYTFDVVKRLQDAQLGEDVSDLRKYIKLGPLGEAFAAQERVVLLIDEIDKARRDFPNDLLHELDKMGFFIPETGEEIVAKYRPIVIITSNHERDLPEPVLRRCVYHYIEFPSPEQMTEIVRAHIPDVDEKLLQSAIEKFYELREIEDLEKKPSTSEMLDWIRVLMKFGVKEIGDKIPFLEVLLKHKEDIELIESKTKEKEGKVKRIPEVIKEVLQGRKVVRLKSARWGEPDPKIVTGLVNMGIQVQTPEDYGRIPFDIYAEGVHRVGELTFAFETNHPIYNWLKEENLIESEWMISEEPLTFEEVHESNSLYTKGIDKEKRTIYRIFSGESGKEKVYVYEQKFSKNQEDEERVF